MESPTAGMLLINNNVYKRWKDGYRMFYLFPLDGGGLIWVPRVTRVPSTANKIRDRNA